MTQNKLIIVIIPEYSMRTKKLHRPFLIKSTLSPLLMASPKASVKREGGGKFCAIFTSVFLRETPVAKLSQVMKVLFNSGGLYRHLLLVILKAPAVANPNSRYGKTAGEPSIALSLLDA